MQHGSPEQRTETGSGSQISVWPIACHPLNPEESSLVAAANLPWTDLCSHCTLCILQLEFLKMLQTLCSSIYGLCLALAQAA